jgi:signal transduction histidine kinase
MAQSILQAYLEAYAQAQAQIQIPKQRGPTSQAHVLKMLSQGAPMMEVLNELCHLIDAKSPEVIPTVLLLDQDGTHLRLAAGPKVPEIWTQAFDGLKIPTYASFEAASGRMEETIPVADIRNDPAFSNCWDLASRHGAQAAWATPILSKDRKILGTVIFFYPTPEEPSERELELMEQTIHMAAIAIECHRHEEELREFSRILYQSHDEERRRIARELHDSTGQKIAALAINLSLINDAVIFRPSKLEKLLEDCTSLTGGISNEIRTLSYLLHPPMLDECGLNLAVQWYVDGINQRGELKVEVEVTQGLRRLTEDAELALFRIVQASLTNVHLHSKASAAKISIEQSPNEVIVMVSDNGQGIPDGVLDRSSRTKTMGIGITGMRERVEQLGGRLEIETGSGGTRVKASVPNDHFRMIAGATAAGMAG